LGANVFTDFSYTATGDRALAAGDITVTPVSTTPDWLGLQFSVIAGDFAVNSSARRAGAASYAISYSVSSASALVGSRLTLSGGAVTRNGTYGTTQTVRVAGSSIVSTSTITNTDTQTRDTPLPGDVATAYRVENSLVLDAPLGTPSNKASVNGITNLFDPQPLATPDPATASLMACGLALLVAGRLRRRQGRPDRG
jgi:hypothetical protein